MPNKCCAFSCSTNYDSIKSDAKVSVFEFPKDDETLPIWIKFVNRVDWKPTKYSVLCEKHFDERFIIRGKKRTKLKYNLRPIPTIHAPDALKTPSCLATTSEPRKTPKQRAFQKDELSDFLATDIIKDFSSLDDIKLQSILPGFQIKRNDDSIVCFRINFDIHTKFPAIYETIKIDKDLHIQLQYNGNRVPLPQFFVKSHNAKLTRFTMLENFPNYIKNSAEEHPYSILDELRKRQHYKPKGRPPYSSELIRYALLLRYTSAQAYRMLLEKFPLPSFSLLEKLKKGGIDSIQAANKLKENGDLCEDIILMVDEMYLQKGTQFHGGDYIGEDEYGELYKGVVVFMITGLKQTVPTVIKACPETTIEGEWLANEISSCLEDLANAGFKVRATVSDNHSSNVRAFKCLHAKYPGDKKHYINFPGINNRLYLFFDTVHLLKNIRNNLFNYKKFVFPAFEFNIGIEHKISSDHGYICWTDIKSIYEKDQKLDANLRQAPKLTYTALNPSNNKQNVGLAIAIFHDTTVAGCKKYLPQRSDVSSFLDLILHWWTIANSNQRFSSNKLSNGFIDKDGKLDFYNSFADWLESWSEISDFCLSKQTSKALVLTLRSQSLLIRELLDNGYDFVLGRRLQTDPLEKRFSQYRQMSGGRFLVSLREVLTSERILTCKSLLKSNVNLWDEDLQKETPNMNELMNIAMEHETEFLELSLSPDSEEVAFTIAGYVTKKLSKRSKCNACKEGMVGNKNDNVPVYFELLSRGGLTIPSEPLAEYVSGAFAILDYADQFIEKDKSGTTTRYAADAILKLYAPKSVFTCLNHTEWGYTFASKIIINIFYNNKQKLAGDKVRKDDLSAFKRRQRSKANE